MMDISIDSLHDLGVSSNLVIMIITYYGIFVDQKSVQVKIVIYHFNLICFLSAIYPKKIFHINKLLLQP